MNVLASTPARLGAYATVLALVLAAAFAVGAAVNPAGETRVPDRQQAHDTRPRGGHSGDSGMTSAAPLPGLAVSQDGYTLAPERTALPAGPDTMFRFQVTGPEGQAVRGYTKTHEKDLHLIVVRRDLSGFQHVHPTRDEGGVWSVPLDLARGGVYRVFADFRPAARENGMTLGTDVSVAGEYRPTPLPPPLAYTRVGGYDVTMRGATTAGQQTELAFTVTRNGQEVRELQPYLGAFGHLVSLRAGDLAYMHTHPAQQAARGTRGGPTVSFVTGFPTAGIYRLFLDFRVDGEVQTAEFTVAATAGGHTHPDGMGPHDHGSDSGPGNGGGGPHGGH